ncbi:MAG: hypothetical protein LBT75_05225 [Bacilli bacterium]|jgi:hypothetical protein|nr:hypothetical protein [Bacilli bacterium]
MKKVKLVLSLVCAFILFSGINATTIKAANADVMIFNFKIWQGSYNPARNGSDKPGSSISYKYYKGTKKLDKSAYVIHSNSAINFYQYLTNASNTSIKYSNTALHSANTRTAYPNNAPEDKSYGHAFMASRQNIWDCSATIKGNWASDDLFGK